MLRELESGRSAAAGPSIAGGFVLIEVASLMHAWRACRSAPLGVGDFRAWLACREMLARRCTLGEGRAPTYSVAELAGLLGVSARRAAGALRRLRGAGLLEWSGAAVAFPPAPEGGPGGPTPGGAIRDSLGGGRGSVAIPRRVLRLLASGSRPALIAAALGVLLRCLSRREGGFRGRGRVKSSWIAEVFAVEPRRVKQARLELVGLGWIAPEPDDQWSLNRWGRAYLVDLDWGGPPGGADRPRSGPGLDPAPGPKSPIPRVSPANGPTDPRPLAPPGGVRLAPPAADFGPSLAPPGSDREPLRGDKNQEPAPGRPPGIESGGRVGGGDRPGTPALASGTTSPAGPPPAPRLADVRAEDLRDTTRALELHRQAAARGWVGDSEADRLRVVSAAEHALAVGRGNPGGLFVHLVRGGLWRYLRQGDEDRACERLRRAMRGGPSSRSVAAGAMARGESPLSADALLVREVRGALIRAGHFGDPYVAFSRRARGWTRERWDRGWEEASREGRSR